MTHDDWDLFAIVRSCKAATFTATTTTPNPPTVTSTATPRSPNTTSCFDSSHENASFSFPNLLQPPTNESQELHQLLIDFNPTTTTTISSTITSAIGINPNSTFSDVAGFIGQQHIQQGHHHHLVPAPTNHTSIGAPSTTQRFQEQHRHQQHQPQTPEQQQRKQNLPQLQAPQTSPILSATTQPQTPRSRKR
ncbi:hypothetical protein V8G54_011550 [Vigna mungo]|uniref:Uncharacterized protein n=1 Tax=Vigna mungo TaxID=3915 RepID=A0AAQ3S359_VIGMU